MINTVFPDTVAFKPTFVAFLQHSQTYVHGLSCHSSKFLWRRVNSKTPTILFGIVAFTFGTTFLEIAVNNIGSFVHCACFVYRVIEPLESYESTQIKSQNDRPSPEIPHESRANLRVPARVCDVEVAQVVLKIAQMAISMEPRGTRACDLRLRLWLLVQKIQCVHTDHFNCCRWSFGTNYTTVSNYARSLEEWQRESQWSKRQLKIASKFAQIQTQ